MGAGASIPETEEEAFAQGYTKKQIEDYKVEVVRLARENALRALELHKAAQNAPSPSEGKGGDLDAGEGSKEAK